MKKSETVFIKYVIEQIETYVMYVQNVLRKIFISRREKRKLLLDSSMWYEIMSK
jgi:hypothetical protein